MAKNTKVENVIVLQSKFDLEFQRVWFGTAKLMPDRIVLKGLFYKRSVMLSQIQEVRWSSDLIVLGLYDGDELDMIIQSAALWKYELQARCSLTDPAMPLVEIDAVVDNPKWTSLESGLPKSQPETSIPIQKELDLSENGFKPVGSTRESSYKVKSLFAHDRPQQD
jgi:hypothetical protein